LVDNGSPQGNHDRLKQFADTRSQVVLIRTINNLGSAGGFGEGLKHALATQNENIWLLDDDNVPAPNTLQCLLSTRVSISPLFPETVLYCYRGQTRLHDLSAIKNGKIKKHPRNGFLGFTVTQAFADKFLGKKGPNCVNYPVIRVFFGPYGGLFAKRATLEKAFLPREDFILYADDHEYTDRFNNIGVDQFLVYSAKIKDIDNSTPAAVKGIFDLIREDFRVFYEVRNHTYLGVRRINNIWLYRVNKFAFLALHLLKVSRDFVRFPNLQITRIKLVMAAIKDGERGCLGRGRVGGVF
jgi:GT2 family glycosyltransferase